MGRDRYAPAPGAAGFPGSTGFPSWNPDGRYPMPILTEEILGFICFGRIDPRTKRASGGHIRGALPKGGGKKWHKEFPATWTQETVREAFYRLLQNQPIIRTDALDFTGTFKGVEIKIEYSLNTFQPENERLHMYPVKGPGVRAWKNGKPYKVSQKYQK